MWARPAGVVVSAAMRSPPLRWRWPVLAPCVGDNGGVLGVGPQLARPVGELLAGCGTARDAGGDAAPGVGSGEGVVEALDADRAGPADPPGGRRGPALPGEPGVRVGLGAQRLLGPRAWGGQRPGHDATWACWQRAASARAVVT